MTDHISKSTLLRLPAYLTYLKSLEADDKANISSKAVAEALAMGEVQVRKDLASISSGGRPKTGYNIKRLISELEAFLGYNSTSNAIIVGTGKLGRALLDYGGFGEYGIEIVAGFDKNVEFCEKTAGGKNIYNMEAMPEICEKENVTTGIIAVSQSGAQQALDMMAKSGIRAILNFAPAHLSAQKNVIIKNENIAAELALVSNMLRDKKN